MLLIAWEEVWWSEGRFQEVRRLEYEWADILVGRGWLIYLDDEETVSYAICWISLTKMKFQKSEDGELNHGERRIHNLKNSLML